MNPYITTHSSEYESAIEHFRKELTQIRTGQANPELVEDIDVEAYDSHTPIQQLASITAPDTKTLVIQPWDKTILKNIEQAIIKADIGFSPVNDGDILRIPMPSMTEENRKHLVKLVNERSEDAKVGMRQIRDKVKHEIQEAEKAKEITEDDKFKFLKDLDKHTSEKVEKIAEMAKKKADQIMTV